MKDKEIKTNFGTIYRHKIKVGHYEILDSEKRILFFNMSARDCNDVIKCMQKYKTIGEWLEQYEDVCWGTKKDIIEYTKDYQEWNDRKFDSKWLEDNWNKIGKTYILFEYSGCYIALPSEEEIARPSSIDSDSRMEKYIRSQLHDKYGYKPKDFSFEFDMRKIYISEIEWGN